MRIAVYSGSFDPLHIGHQAIMEYLTRERTFDWVYLVISPQNPFKDPSKALSGERRYRAAIDAVRRHPELHVWVDNIELQMDPPHYTIRTLDALRRREPENEFTLVVGADNLENMLRWRDAPRILSEYGPRHRWLRRCRTPLQNRHHRRSHSGHLLHPHPRRPRRRRRHVGLDDVATRQNRQG